MSESEELYLELLDKIARRYYSSYYVLTRDCLDENFCVAGIKPDIVASSSPSMEESDIKFIALVGTPDMQGDRLPVEWHKLLEASPRARWELDLFVPRAAVARVEKLAKQINPHVNVIPLPVQ